MTINITTSQIKNLFKMYDLRLSFQKDKTEEKKEPEPAKDEDDDDWGAVPAFLRRSKLK